MLELQTIQHSNYQTFKLWPLNPDVFGEDDFAPSGALLPTTTTSDGHKNAKMTHQTENREDANLTPASENREDANIAHQTENREDANITPPSETNEDANIHHPTEKRANVTQTPTEVDSVNIQSTSSATEHVEKHCKGVSMDISANDSVHQQSSSMDDSWVSVYDLHPLPDTVPPTTTDRPKRKRQACQSEVLTSTPVKKALVEKMEKMAKSKPRKRCTGPKARKVANFKGVSGKGNTHKGKDPKTEEWFCIFCAEQYHEPPTEDWILCLRCRNWAHEKCTDYGTGPSSSHGYVCDVCRDI